MINHPQPLSVLLWSLKVQGQLGTIFRPQWTFMEPFMCTVGTVHFMCTAGTVHCMCIVHCWGCAFYVHCALFTAHITLERHYTVHNKCTSVTIFSFLSPQLYADALCISALFLYSAHFSQIESTENHSAEWKRVKILQTKVKESSSQSSLLSSFLINLIVQPLQQRIYIVCDWHYIDLNWNRAGMWTKPWTDHIRNMFEGI